MKINYREFNKKGFLVIKNFLNKKDIIKVSSELNKYNFYKDKDVFFEKINNKNRLRRLEKVSSKLTNVKKIIKSKKLKNILESLSKKKLVLFKDKLNFKYGGGAGYSPHIDGHYTWVDKNGSKNYGWRKYSNYFLNVVIPIDNVKIKNGCLYVGNKNNIKKLGNNYNQVIKSLSKNKSEIPKKINSKIKYCPIELNSGDILIFDWKCPHYSKKNYSSLSRRQMYITYCNSKIINPRQKYYFDRKNTKSGNKKLSLLN